MFTRKPRLQLEKFAINGAKRLLQHNRHEPTYSSLSHQRPTEIGSKLEPPQRDVPKSCSISNGGVAAYGGPPYNRNLSSEHPNSCVPTRGRHET